jgi:hypothetical protein
MKYLIFVLLLVAILITAGCTSGNQKTVVTPTQTTAQISMTTLTTTAPTTAVSTQSQMYKTADLIIPLSTNSTYGFKMDYPSEWTYKTELQKFWDYGYNFSSPDEKSNVYVYMVNNAGTGRYYYPLITPAENRAGNAASGSCNYYPLITPTNSGIYLSIACNGSWAGNIIKADTESYCLDGAGNPGKPGECSSAVSGTSYLHRRLISEETVTLSGDVNAYKMVFTPDVKDRQSTEAYTTAYIMYAGKMQGYNFTVPGHPEVAVKVDGPVWDYAKDGQAYAIWMHTPSGQVNATSDIFDHMIKSFEITIK